MTEQPEFEARFSGDLRALRRQRGPCPDAGTLERYQHKELSLEDTIRVKNHVESCGLCDTLLERMAPLTEESVSSRLRFWLEMPLKAALPYVVIVALVYPAWLGVTRRTPASDSAPRMESVQRIDLVTERGAAPAAGLRLRGSKVVVHFFVPLREGSSYEAEIQDGSQKAVVPPAAITSTDALGNFEVFLDLPAVTTGSFTLVVTERETNSRAVLRQVRFPFAL